MDGDDLDLMALRDQAKAIRIITSMEDPRGIFDGQIFKNKVNRQNVISFFAQQTIRRNEDPISLLAKDLNNLIETLWDNKYWKSPVHHSPEESRVISKELNIKLGREIEYGIAKLDSYKVLCDVLEANWKYISKLEEVMLLPWVNLKREDGDDAFDNPIFESLAERALVLYLFVNIDGLLDRLRAARFELTANYRPISEKFCRENGTIDPYKIFSGIALRFIIILEKKLYLEDLLPNIEKEKLDNFLVEFDKQSRSWGKRVLEKTLSTGSLDEALECAPEHIQSVNYLMNKLLKQ